MGLFSRKKKEEPENEKERLEENMRDDISKAYDELISGAAKTEKAQSTPEGSGEKITITADPNLGAEIIKLKIKMFKEKKTNEALTEVFKAVSGKKFLVPSVANMKEPLEMKDGALKLKAGVKLTPALLSSNQTTYLPIFTDEKSIVQKAPSGINLQYNFEQCVGIVYNKKNPVKAIVINPFTENFIISEQLLKAVFKQVDKSNPENGKK